MEDLTEDFNYEVEHSMAIANLNKSKELVTNTTTASKYMPNMVSKLLIQKRR